MFGLPGGTEVIIILVVLLLLFGPTQLPKLMRGLGEGVKSLRDLVEGKFDDDKEEKKEDSNLAP